MGERMTDISPELAERLARRRNLVAAFVRASTAADELEFAIRRGEVAALARQAELPTLREAEQATSAAMDENDYAIARFASQTIADVAAKMRVVATEIHDLRLGPAPCDEDDRLDDAFVRGVVLDLNRFAAS